MLSEEEGWVSVENVTLGEALAKMNAVDFDDWPFRGPRALPELLAAILATGLTLTSYWGYWVSESGVSRNAAVAQEVRHALNQLHHAVTYDLVDPSNLASLELLGRRVLQIQRAVKRCPRHPSFEGLGLMLSSSLDESGGIVTSRFDAFVAEEQKSQGIILKQGRMYREEQESEAKKYERQGDDRERGSRADPKGKAKPKPKAAAKESVIKRVRRRIRGFGDRPKDMDCAGALQELLKCKDLYSNMGEASTRRDYDADKLNVLRRAPQDRPRQLRDVAPRHVTEALDHFDSDVVRPAPNIPEDEVIVEPYWGPLLNPRDPQNRPRLVDFLRRLAARGLVDGRARRKACVSTFFVAKKNGDIRMVVDARQPNQLHKLPPRTVLASGEALGSINLLDAVGASPEDLADFDGCYESLCAGSVDLMDGFYQFADPSWGSWMCFDVEVTADELGIDSIYDEKLGRRVAVSGDDVIWPCFAALPMGWSWALWICHEVLVDAMVEAGLPSDGWCLDKARAPTLVGQAVVRAPYVDNGNLASLSAPALNDRLDKLTAELDRRGLRWHELERAQPGLVILGLVLDGREGRLRHTAKRAWRLYLALHHVLRIPWLARWQLRRIVGHLVHYFSVVRPGLSVLGACYTFIGDGDLSTVVRLPGDVLGELAVAAGLVFLGEVDLCRVPSDIAFTTDSSLRGYAVCEARLEPWEVPAATRWRERQRFVATEPEVAPDDEQYEGRAAGFCDISEPLPVELPPRLRHAAAKRRRVELEIGVPPEPLADALLDAGRWVERRRGAWRRPGRIHALEARAAVAPLWRAAADVNFHGKEILSLCDNMSSVLAFEKGRATNFELLAQCRRAAAVCFGCEIRWRPRHVPGIYNVADHGSRAADRGELLPGRYRGRGALSAPTSGSRRMPVVPPAAGKAEASPTTAVEFEIGIKMKSRKYSPTSDPDKIDTSMLETYLLHSSLLEFLYGAHMYTLGHAKILNRTLLSALGLLRFYNGAHLYVLGHTKSLNGHWWVPVGGTRDPAPADRTLVAFTVRVVRLCRSLGIFVTFENPPASRVWKWPALERELQRLAWPKVLFDSCRFGAPFKKPGAIAGSLPGLGHLALRCCCACRHRVELQGKVRHPTRGWTWRTTLAGAYLPSWCRLLVSLAGPDAPQSAFGRSTQDDLQARAHALASAAGVAELRGVTAAARGDVAAGQRQAAPGEYLRLASLRPATVDSYTSAVTELTDYANRRGLLLTTPELADETLNLYFEDLFFAGEPQYLARNALYGLCKVRGWSASRPRFHKAKDALTGWSAKLPTTPREPPPFEAVQLTCAVLDNGTTSDLLACLASATGFDMYFRPGELLAIKPEHVFGSRTSGRASDITVVVAPLAGSSSELDPEFTNTLNEKFHVAWPGEFNLIGMPKDADIVSPSSALLVVNATLEDVGLKDCDDLLIRKVTVFGTKLGSVSSLEFTIGSDDFNTTDALGLKIDGVSKTVTEFLAEMPTCTFTRPRVVALPTKNSFRKRSAMYSAICNIGDVPNTLTLTWSSVWRKNYGDVYYQNDLEVFVSGAKKKWCCENYEAPLDCEDVLLGAQSAAEGADDATPGSVTTTASTTTETTSLAQVQERYDCREGYAKWETGWSDSKKVLSRAAKRCADGTRGPGKDLGAYALAPSPSNPWRVAM
ncbi:unnamed protein product [Prorocentrum cordatum]|uniref:Uncharacterized protein n=1 Tax=Prorocentrum cordatum TaxID=2364126 RepID=A0ABN9YAM6_9DINO|nr:unnamed protein product [Polarella glacialis]